MTKMAAMTPPRYMEKTLNNLLLWSFKVRSPKFAAGEFAAPNMQILPSQVCSVDEPWNTVERSKSFTELGQGHVT